MSTEGEQGLPLRSKSKQENEKVDSFADIIGESGPYHRYILLVYITIYLISPTQNYGITFYAESPDFWCKSAPNSNLNISRSTCTVSSESNETCQEWEYDKSFYRSTIVTEFDLVCDRSLFISYSKSVYQVGYLISSILFGWISDKHGRQLAFRLAVILEIFSGLSQALSVDIYMFMVSRLFLGIAAFSRFLTGMIIIVEWAGPKTRGRIRLMTEIGWSVGYFLLPLLFYFIRDFRYMQLLVVTFEILLLYPLMKFPESPQWLLIHGKMEKLTDVLTEAAIRNKKGTREDVVRKLELLQAKYQEEEKEKVSDESRKTILDFWKVPSLLKYAMAQYFIWFSYAFAGYGITYNAGALGSSLFLNFVGFAIIDSVNTVLTYFVIDRVKRRTLFFVFMFTSAAYSFAMVPIALQTDDYIWLRVTLLMVGRFASTGIYHIIYLMAAEIYPTSVRHVGVGSNSVAARFGSTLAPFVKELTEATNLATTFALFAVLFLISGLLGLLLPETKDEPIPDTIKQAARRKSFALSRT